MVRMAKLADAHALENVEMRAAYNEALMAAAERNENVVAVDCDMANAMGTAAFAGKFGNRRSINCGIQEANALGVAAGLSALGYVPFYHTFACYASRRVYDQAYISCAYANLNVKIIGGEVGACAAANGGTHMPFDDVGLMRTIPGVTVLEPADSASFPDLVTQMADAYGVFYLRTPRRANIRVYGEGNRFEIGKAMLLREGSDVTIIGYGITVYQALLAAGELAKEGIDARVADMFTIKPIDADFIADSAKRTGAIVTVENHSVVNGLGSAVSDVLAGTVPVPMEMAGCRDEFGEVGTQDWLMERFGMTARAVCEKVRAVLSRKRAEAR